MSINPLLVTYSGIGIITMNTTDADSMSQQWDQVRLKPISRSPIMHL